MPPSKCGWSNGGLARTVSDDMASSNDSYLCHDFDEAEPLLEYLISSASNSVSCRPQAKTSAETGHSGRVNEENLGAVIRA